MFTNGVDFDNLLSIATYIVITLVSFQWITRAYFPQAVDHAVYMLMPVWVLRWLQKRYLKKVSSQMEPDSGNH
jgi:Flp pilus assembly protein TadB